MKDEQQAEVTQEDREAAADIWRDMIAKPGECIAEKQIRAGGAMDAMPLTQALARHRQRAEAAKEAAAQKARADALRILVAGDEVLVTLNGTDLQVQGTFVGYVEGWCEVRFCDDSTAICRPSNVAIRSLTEREVSR